MSLKDHNGAAVQLVKVARGRQAWVERIRAAYGRTVEAVFQVGRELLQAKQELPHGEFTVMIERELPFSARTAQRYMAIAVSVNFQKRHIVSLLPSYWGTLEVLQRLDPLTFDAAVKAGKIYSEMTRAEAEALLPAPKVAPLVQLSDGARREGGKLIAESAEHEADWFVFLLSIVDICKAVHVFSGYSAG